MKATAPLIAETLDRLLGVPKSTALDFASRLRRDESLFRRGKQGPGALAVSATELANWTIAVCAATAITRKSPDAVDTVKLARGATRILEPDLAARCPPEAVEGLAISQARTFGEAIDGLIADMRSGAFKAWRGEDHPSSLHIRFFDNGARIVFNFWRWRAGAAQAAVLVFRRDRQDGDMARALTHVAELDGYALEVLAAAIGREDD